MRPSTSSSLRPSPRSPSITEPSPVVVGALHGDIYLLAQIISAEKAPAPVLRRLRAWRRDPSPTTASALLISAREAYFGVTISRASPLPNNHAVRSTIG